jgi:rRNA-processing protein FCF1
MAPAEKQLALDTNFLFDLAEKAEFALDFKEEFQSRGYDFLLPPTVVVELAALSEEGSARQRRVATTALQNLDGWKFLAIILSDFNLNIAQEFRLKMSRLELIPDEEWNDGVILAETALAHIPLLVTSDEELLGIDDAALQVALAESSLPAVHPVHPKRLLRAIR